MRSSLFPVRKAINSVLNLLVKLSIIFPGPLTVFFMYVPKQTPVSLHTIGSVNGKQTKWLGSSSTGFQTGKNVASGKKKKDVFDCVLLSLNINSLSPGLKNAT